jgi:endonuclease/exonuclease/phosphatase family metal-dependent hydrolase
MMTVPKRRARVWCTAVLAAALLVAACSSDGSDSSDANGARDASDGADTAAEEPAAAPLRVVTLNLLHGFFCPPETDSCQAPDRVRIFTELVEAADCPDAVGLQEIGARLEELLPPAVATMCDGQYTIAWHGSEPAIDREMVLTRLPVIDQGYLDIANFPWEAYWVRLDSSQGPVDFLTAHFASSSNNPPCAPDVCPPLCAAGTVTNQCHALEVVDFLDRRPPGAVLSIASGDLNATPGSPTVSTLLDAGFVDAWLEAGNAECDPATHTGCTGGGHQPEPFVGMNTPEGPGYDERIDYVMVRPAAACELAVGAEAFAAEPRAEALNGMWWPADHAGVLAELSCR